MRQRIWLWAIFATLAGCVGTAQAQQTLQDSLEKFQDKLPVAQMSQGAETAHPLGANPLGENRALPIGRSGPGQPLVAKASDDRESASADNIPPDPFTNMIVADSKITEVTVFNDRARVTRTAVVEVPAGTHTIVFKKLAGLMPETLHASGQANAKVTFGTVAQKEIIESSSGSQREEQDREAQIRDLKDQQALIDVENNSLTAETEFLTGIIQKADDGQSRLASGKDAPPPLSIKPEEWAKTTQAIYDRIYEIRKAQDAEDVKKNDLEEQVTAARIELGRSMPRKQVIRCVTVPVEAGKATKLTVKLTYQILNATWQPLYDARLTTGGDSGLQLVQYATVRQATGEDWAGVSLTLSTAQPNRATNQPDLGPVWMDIYKPTEEPAYSAVVQGGQETKVTVGRAVNDAEYSKKLAAQNKKEAEFAVATGQSTVPTPIGPSESQKLSIPATPAAPPGDPLAEWRAKTEAKRVQMENEQAPEEKEAESSDLTPLVKAEPVREQVQIRAAEINNGGFVSEYKIPGVSTIPSDGTDIKVLVGNFDAESKIEVRIEPQVSEEAYLVVVNKLKGDAPVLPGKVNLFRDGAYIGQSMLPLLRPGETHDIFFGIDDQVSVSHKTLKDEHSQLGLIAHQNILERAGVTEIQNLHKAPVNIVLKEIMPVSRDEKLKIDVAADNLMSSGYRLNEGNIQGLVDWEFKMAPQEKKEVHFGWKATWPDSYDVSGL